MLYRSEVVIGGRVVRGATYKDATHPRQVVRRITTPYRGSKTDFLKVLVLNEEGMVWGYAMKRNLSGEYEVLESVRASRAISESTMIDIMAGNRRIEEVL